MGILRYDGPSYRFVPLKADLFLGISAPVSDCLGGLVGTLLKSAKLRREIHGAPLTLEGLAVRMHLHESVFLCCLGIHIRNQAMRRGHPIPNVPT